MTEQNIQTFALPDKYKALGVTCGFKPSPADDLNIVIVGRAGDGKSSLVASDPNAIAFDFDRAQHNVYGRRCGSLAINSWGDYAALKAALLDDASKGKRPCKRVVFDTVDCWLDMLDPYILGAKQAQLASNPNAAVHLATSITEYGQSGSGYRVLRTALMKEIKDFERAGYRWTANCQLKVTREKTETADGIKTVEVKRCLMAPTFFDLLVMNADLCGYIYSEARTENVFSERMIGGKSQRFKSGTNKVIKYFLNVKPTDTTGEQKRRLLGLNTTVELPPVDGWQAFASSYDKTIQELKAREQVAGSEAQAPAQENVDG